MDLLALEQLLADPGHPFHLQHMQLALEEARLAYAEEEVPVGAVVVSLREGVLGRDHNRREQRHDPTAHAEMLAITQASSALRSWRLDGCLLYVTLEPCPMCAGAIVLARLPAVVYGCTDPKAGACETLYDIPADPRLNHRARLLGGVCAGECAALLTGFFRDRRAEGKKFVRE